MCARRFDATKAMNSPVEAVKNDMYPLHMYMTYDLWSHCPRGAAFWDKDPLRSTLRNAAAQKCNESL